MSVFARVIDTIANLARRPGRSARTFAWASATFALFSYAQAYALSLGELQVMSRLGQPFDAVVRITGATGENLHARCFSLNNTSGAALPQVTDVRLTLSTRLSAALEIRGVRPMREPMSELIIKVECPGVPRFQRTFMVLLDPPADVALRQPAASAAPDSQPVRPASVTAAGVASGVAATAPPARAQASPRVEPRRRYRGPNDPVQPGTAYLVRPGDVLSMIASRVVGRGTQSLWPLAERIVIGNPDAFIDGNPDLLIVGSRLFIPDLRSTGTAATPAAPATRVAKRQTSGGDPARVAAEQDMSSAIPAVGQVTLAATVASTPPLSAMVLARRLGAVSRERLTLRREGRLQTSATPTAAPPTPPAPQPDTPDPAVPAPLQAATAVRSAPQPVQIVRRGGWLVWLGLVIGLLLGALASAFGLRNWARSNADARLRDMVRAQRHQERLDQSRRTRPSDEEPAIVVEEDRPAAGQPENRVPPAAALFAIDPMALPGDQAASDAQPDDGSDEIVVTANVAEELQAPPSDELNLQDIPELTGDFEAPDEFDLELLARDYAQSRPDISKLTQEINDAKPMLDHAELGFSDGTQIMNNSLDLELPEEAGSGAQHASVADDDGDDFGPNTLEQEMLALDYGLEGAGVSGQDTATDNEADSREQFAAAGDDRLTAPLSLEEQDDGGDIPGRVSSGHHDHQRDSKSEDYYHLEASSIMDVGDLSFDAEASDDESKILEFRKRPGKTGTNDASSDD